MTSTGSSNSSSSDATTDMEATARFDLGSTSTGVGLQVRCPHCHDPITLSPDSELESIACPMCMLPDKKRFVGFVPDEGPIGELVLADVAAPRPVATLGESVHVLLNYNTTPDGSFITAFHKGGVEIIRRYSAADARTALERLDMTFARDWYQKLVKIYKSHPEVEEQ